MKRRLLALFMMVCLVFSTVGQSSVALAQGDSAARSFALSENEPDTVADGVQEPDNEAGQDLADPESVDANDEAGASDDKADNTDTTEDGKTNDNDTTDGGDGVSEENGIQAADGTEIKLTEQTIVADCPQGTIHEGDQVVVSGLLPEGAIAVAIPVDMEVEGQEVLVAYDISVYADKEQQAADIKWQPEESKIQVEIISTAIKNADNDVEVWHKDGEDTNPEYVTSTSTDGSSVVYDTDTLTVSAVTEVILTQTITTSDGSTYDVEVSYQKDAGIPMHGTDLLVAEILPGDSQYDDYVNASVEKIGITVAEIEFARVFDITIVDAEDHEKKFEPLTPVNVRITLTGTPLEEYSQVDILHFVEDEKSNVEVNEIDHVVDGESVEFETDGFSVYVVVAGPEPYSPGSTSVTEMSDIVENQGYTFRIARSGVNYMTGNAANDATEFAGVTNVANAETWFFEESDTAGKYYIYRKKGENKEYISVTYPNLMALSTTEKTLFSVEKNTRTSVPGSFYIYIIADDKNYALSVRGNRNFFLENRNNGANANECVVLEKVPSVPDDYYDLDGKVYGLMYWNGENNSATGLLDTANSSVRLNSVSLFIRQDPMDQSRTLYIAKDSVLPMWAFHSIDADNYYVTVGSQYLRIASDGVTIVDVPDEYCKIQVVPGTGNREGKVQLIGVSAQRALNSRSNFFEAASINPNNSTQWLNFAAQSVYEEADFVEYSAYKVAISDRTNIPNGAQVVIYTRRWNDKDKRYEFYVVSHNGDLIPAYESSDCILWIGTQNNTALWDFTEYYYPGTTNPNNYYELQNVYTENYVAPQLTDNQVFSDSTIGIQLNGRRYGEYESTILVWDDTHFDYAGLKTTDDGKVVPCSMVEAEDFYFAVMTLNDTPGLTEVQTVDHEALGLTVKIVDFNGDTLPGGTGISPTTQKQYDVIGTQEYSEGNAQQGLLSTNLDNGVEGYPTATKTDRSLAELFADATKVNHLFIQSIYDDSGYYQFESTENFAHFDGRNFQVYRELGTVASGAGTRQHGQFMPYNMIDKSVIRQGNEKNLTDIYGNALSDNYPRKYEQMYGFSEDDDYYFGLEIEGHFMQTPNGCDAWGHDIVFEFVGDDDFWLYVDGELVIDLGGIHKALGATVNYSNGKVVTNGQSSTLYEIFGSNYAARNNLDVNDPAVTEYLDGIFQTKEVDGETCYVFRDYSAHTVRIFYMERGAGASNLRMRFNLATVTPGQVLLSKELTGAENQEYTNVRFPFQIYYNTDSENENYQLLTKNEADTGQWKVMYENTTTNVDSEASVIIDGVEYTDVFYLKPGETAAIQIPDETIKYYIKECGVNSQIYDQVTVNGDEVVGVAVGTSGTTKDYSTTKATVTDRTHVVFGNRVNSEELHTVTITKRLFDAAGNELTREADNTGFRFRVFLGDDLGYYNQGNYYVKDPNGYYCYFDSETESFTSIGVNDFGNLTEAQKIKVTFVTSPSGAADKLPAGYSIEIRDLMEGTKYKVTEEDYDIPVGYGKRTWTDNGVEYTCYKRVADVQEGDAQNEGVIRAGASPVIEIHNQRGFGIRAEKVWSDAEFMLSHDDVYFAVFVNGVLLPDTIAKIDSYNYTTYFFKELESGATFADYQVREVLVELDDEEVPHYLGTVEGDTTHITIGGKKIDNTQVSGLEYKATYKQGDGESFRTDVVTNTRVDSLTIRKTDMNGNGLSGAKFVLKEGDTELSTYTSADGLVAVISLEAGKTFTITETVSPLGYQTLTTQFSIEANGDGYVITPEGESGGYEYDEQTKTLTIRNKPFTLKAVKVDSNDGSPMEGVHFALYRQIKASNGSLRKDYYPIEGYDNLVSDSNGLISLINESLKQGTYYLVETQTVTGYELPGKDVLFTISSGGEVTIDTDSAYIGSLTTTEDEDHTQVDYTITVPNVRDSVVLTISKTVAGGPTDEEFTFTLNSVTDQLISDSFAYIKTLVNGETESGEIMINGTFTLKNGETIAITLPVNKQVVITEANGEYTTSWSADNNTTLEVTSGEGTSTVAAQLTRDTVITVINSLGEVAPTGVNIHLLPFVLILVAGVICIAIGLFAGKRRKKKA